MVKAILLLALLFAGVVLTLRYMNHLAIEFVPLVVLFYVSVLILLIVFFVFILVVYKPLRLVTKQITNLLTGKVYRRVQPTSIDELGVVTHFFNEITQDLEKISKDVKERRRMSSELDIASQIQRDVLPKEMPETPGLDVVAKTRSAAEVGGDTFDFLTSPDGDQVFIYIGDVTGHGVPSGLIMMMVETLVTAMVYRGIDNSRDLVVHTNGLLYPRISNRLFMTSIMLRWDKPNQKMFYTGAGHEHILIHRHATQEVEAITSGGIALGMIPDVEKIAKESEIPLAIGDTIVLYTDGITEAKDSTGVMYGLDSLVRSLQRNAIKASAESVFEGITKDFSRFVGEYVQNDDITMIVIKYMGQEAVSGKIRLTISKDQTEVESTSKTWGWD